MVVCFKGLYLGIHRRGICFPNVFHASSEVLKYHLVFVSSREGLDPVWCWARIPLWEIIDEETLLCARAYVRSFAMCVCVCSRVDVRVFVHVTMRPIRLCKRVFLLHRDWWGGAGGLWDTRTVPHAPPATVVRRPPQNMISGRLPTAHALPPSVVLQALLPSALISTTTPARGLLLGNW